MRGLATRADDTDEVLVEEHGSAKKVVLNRPKALNALSLPMIRKLTPLYRTWQLSPDTVVVMRGAGDKAFCAGGDIRAIYDTCRGSGTPGLESDFFYEEYNLNFAIAQRTFTSVALLNGITMGGGVGLSVHGQYRVATEKTLFAMPETAIGFFPDVGGSYFLPRLPGGIGMYLGLTGARLQGEDLKVAQIATHFVKTEQLDELEDQLLRTPAEDIRKVLDSFSGRTSGSGSTSQLTKQLPWISKVFNQYDLEGIFKSLEEPCQDKAEQEWRTQTLETLNKMSPTSLMVVVEQLKRGSTMQYKEVFEMEYALSQAFMQGHDFFEGVRAALVDKDKMPKWNPPTIAQLSPQQIRTQYFEVPPKKPWTPF